MQFLLYTNAVLLHTKLFGCILHANSVLLHPNAILLYANATIARQALLLHASSVLMHPNAVLLYKNAVLLHAKLFCCIPVQAVLLHIIASFVACSFVACQCSFVVYKRKCRFIACLAILFHANPLLMYPDAVLLKTNAVVLHAEAGLFVAYQWQCCTCQYSFVAYMSSFTEDFAVVLHAKAGLLHTSVSAG